MAQEAALLRDNPQLENIVRADLQEARLIAQEELQGISGSPRTRQEWEMAVINRVAPEGAAIEPGMTDEMLESAYQSFRPLYDSAKGYPVDVEGFGQVLRDSPLNPAIMSTDPERRSVQGWINQQLTKYKGLQSGQAPSDELLDLRSSVRDEIRTQESRGRDERADLLRSTEAAITQRLENSLPAEVVDTLRQTDSQYRKYKVVENAIFEAGDKSLTAADLSNSVQSGGLTTPGRYARGVDPVTEELRRMALGGQSSDQFIGNPERAARVVRDMPEPERQAIQADFVDTLMRRATSAEATDSGIPFISGDKLMTDFRENTEVMKKLGMTSFDILRFERIAKQIKSMSQRSPEAVDNLFEDGPANLLQLGAALMGAKSGQRLAGQGMGSSLVLAQYMSNKARSTLASLTSNEAERLMRDAVTDPDLYKALLTQNTASPETLRQRAQYLESWLLSSAFDKAQGQENGN